MADLKDEASALYQVTKTDAKIQYARQQVMWALMGPGGTSGPELTKVLQEFYSYIATWDTLKQDPATTANPAQLAELAQTVSAAVDAYIARAQQAKAIDDAKATSKPAPAPQGPSKPAAPQAPSKPAPGPAAPPAAAAPPEPPAGPKAPPPPAGKTKALGGDNLLLLAAVGLGAAALFVGGKKRRG